MIIFRKEIYPYRIIQEANRMEDIREKFIHSKYFKSLNDDILLLYRHTGHCLDNYGDVLGDSLENAMRGIYKALEDYASVKKKDNTGS